MLDMRKEKLVSMTEAAKILPLVDGKKPHLSTIFRWMKIGIRGVQLEHIYIGRKLCTSEEALQRFFQASTDAAPVPRPQRSRAGEKARTAGQREAAVAKAKERLAANGVKVA